MKYENLNIKALALINLYNSGKTEEQYSFEILIKSSNIFQVTKTPCPQQPQKGTPVLVAQAPDITPPSVNPRGDRNVCLDPPRGFLTPPAARSTTTVGRTLKRTGGAST